MPPNPEIGSNVYQRYALSLANVPMPVTPSAHSNELELLCAKQSMAVYGVYPTRLHIPEHDHIPSRHSELIASGEFDVRQMIVGSGDSPSRDFNAEQGYRVVTADRAGALLTWKDHHLVIAFRGTASWQDWIHNFTTRRITADRMKQGGDLELHKGFFGLAENIAPAVTELVCDFLERRGHLQPGTRVPPPVLTLCGHSLGGALALHYAIHLSHLLREGYYGRDSLGRLGYVGPHAIRLGATYTFGAPRIGAGQVWQYIRRPHYRLIVRGDPVPSTPPGFAEDYQGAYLDPDDKPSPHPRGVAGAIAKAAGTLFKRVSGIDFAAHDIETYIEAIEAKCKCG